ncbi:nuclear transport factor 2 family protein [Marivirga salinae]|uniref:Nuclear transport factor 2 family protein n=1 Tax=Marivirga salinarum TaxID=3059078 RepID=A0AA49GBS7_9BACT|nr:nuclear transport factor 2 family protein [Marivirga sp. BDSF4-3]WKK75988.2 nuclear transport factor 2 family protein [Marivirga sp. BDSF4-3]
MKKIIFFTTFIFFISFSAFTQSYQRDSTQIAEIIQDVFDGMRESDTTKMAPYMHPNVKMQSLNVDGEGNEVSQLNGAQGWLNAVAKNKGDVWNEQIDNLKIQTDGEVASAWMDYKFYLGDKLSHCGINSFQFIKMDGKWKIIYIIDSRFKSNCSE